MAVQYFDVARLSEDAADALGVKFRLFNELLRTSDIVSLHVPLIPSTRHMMGAAQFRLMKPTAYLINTCRGPVVDEPALHEALTNGTIAGAGLDVFDQEPPPANNPLFTLDNVILTPHYAGPTWDNQSARFRNGFDNVRARGARREAAVGDPGAAGVVTKRFTRRPLRATEVHGDRRGRASREAHSLCLRETPWRSGGLRVHP